jgi:DNA-directed RNA polymerase specialized sigma subunit
MSDEMKFFGDSPIRNEVFDNYEDTNDPDEALKDAQFSWQGNPDAVEIQAPEKNNAGRDPDELPSTEMPDEPPSYIKDVVDEEEWQAAQSLDDSKKHNYWRRYAYGNEEDYKKYDNPKDVPRVRKEINKWRAENPGEGQPTPDIIADRLDSMSEDEVRERMRIRGKVFGELENIAYKAINSEKHTGSPVSAYEEFADDQLLRRIDQFDPKIGSQISTYAYDSLINKNKLKEVSRKFADMKPVDSRRYTDLPKINKAIEKFKEAHGQPPSNQELADRLEDISLEQIKRTRMETADEGDIGDVMDDSQLPIGDTGKQKDAIKIVYADANSQEQKIMEYMFPSILGGEAPPMDFQSGGWGWVADQLDLPRYTVSRRKSDIEERIKEQA